MNRLKLSVLAVVSLVIAGCQTANQLAYDEQVSIFRPELWLKDDALYYAAKTDAHGAELWRSSYLAAPRKPHRVQKELN